MTDKPYITHGEYQASKYPYKDRDDVCATEVMAWYKERINKRIKTMVEWRKRMITPKPPRYDEVYDKAMGYFK